MDTINTIFTAYGLVGAFIVITAVMLMGYGIAKGVKQQRMGSAIAILLALVLAYIGGTITGGSSGVSDIAAFSGIALLGGAMLRDYTIISTAYGVDVSNLKKAGLAGIISLLVGIVVSFVIGGVIAYLCGYTSAVDVATIGAGTATFVVGPVTGTALGASSEVIALSIAAGVVKSVLAMIVTPIIAPIIKLDNPTSAMVFGGLIGSTSGVAGGLAATDPKLVPYGAMVATFYTGVGTLLCPSVLYLIVKAILG